MGRYHGARSGPRATFARPQDRLGKEHRLFRCDGAAARGGRRPDLADLAADSADAQSIAGGTSAGAPRRDDKLDQRRGVDGYLRGFEPRRDRPAARLSRALGESDVPRECRCRAFFAARPTRRRRGALHIGLGTRLSPALPDDRLIRALSPTEHSDAGDDGDGGRRGRGGRLRAARRKRSSQSRAARPGLAAAGRGVEHVVRRTTCLVGDGSGAPGRNRYHIRSHEA